jgi:hypothetical protein
MMIGQRDFRSHPHLEPVDWGAEPFSSHRVDFREEKVLPA